MNSLVIKPDEMLRLTYTPADSNLSRRALDRDLRLDLHAQRGILAHGTIELVLRDRFGFESARVEMPLQLAALIRDALDELLNDREVLQSSRSPQLGRGDMESYISDALSRPRRDD